MTPQPASRVVIGLASTTFTNLATALVGVATGVMAGRLLGPEQRGTLAATQNWAGLLYGFGAMGLTTAAGYYSSRRPEDSGRLLTSTLLTLLLWSIPLMSVAYILMPHLLPGQPLHVVQHARLYLLMVPIQFGIGVSFSILQGLSQFRLWNILRFQGPLAWLVALGVSWAMTARTAEPVLDIYLILMLCVACVFIVAAMRCVQRPLTPDVSTLPRLVRYGFPTFLTNVPQFLNLRLDQLLMAGLLPPQYLGQYVVAVAWSGSLSALLTSVAQVLFPTLAGMQDSSARIQVLQRALRLSACLSLVLVLIVWPLTSICIPLFFGRSFAPAIAPASVLVLAGGIAAFNQIAGEAARGLGATKYPLFAEGAGLLITVVLLALLLRRYQLMGAAVASLLSYLATAVTLVSLLARNTRSRPGSLIFLNKGDIVYLGRTLSSAGTVLGECFAWR